MDLIQLFAWGMKRDIVPPVAPLDEGGDVLNLGAGESVLDWDRSFRDRVVDLDLPEWDADLEGLEGFADESIDGIFAFHFLEHLDHPIAMLLECQRVLRIGAPLTIVVPYYSSQLQAQDLNHKHAFSEETWKTLMYNYLYATTSGIVWRFEIGTNVIMGVAERNIVLLTQLIKK